VPNGAVIRLCSFCIDPAAPRRDLSKTKARFKDPEVHSVGHENRTSATTKTNTLRVLIEIARC